MTIEEKAAEMAEEYFGDDGDAYVDTAYEMLVNIAMWAREDIRERERDLYLTVDEIFGRHFMNELEYQESLDEFKKHLKVYEPHR